MRKSIITLAAFGAMALPLAAADYPNYPGPQGPINGWSSSPADVYAQPYACSPHWGTACPGNGSADEYYRQRDRYRVNRLMEFLCYKPTVPCEFWLRPTCYVPPNYTMFPPCCNATGCGCDSCGYGCRPHLFRTARSGCGPTCNPGYAPMANGYPAMPMPPAGPAMPVAAPMNGWQPMTAMNAPNRPATMNGWQPMTAMNPPSRPATVLYTKAASPAVSYSPAPVFVPVTQRPANASAQNSAGTFNPTWLNQQSGPQYPVTPTGYYSAPRQ